MHNLTQIKYITSDIAYFPNLYQFVNHGFSWGKNSKNMSFKYGPYNEVKQNIQTFLSKLHMGTIEDVFSIRAEHKNRIININPKFLKTHKEKSPSHQNIDADNSIPCDAIFTSLPDLTLTIKPADCTTSIIWGQKDDFITSTQTNSLKNASSKTQEKSHSQNPSTNNCIVSPNSPDSSVIGLIHTGRRGVETNLIPKSIQMLQNSYGIDPSNVIVAFVPHLTPQTRKFEHLRDVKDHLWGDFITEKDGYYYLDETGFAIQQYKESGILDSNIYNYQIDTYKAASEGKTFSYKFTYNMRQKNKEVREGRFLVAVRKHKQPIRTHKQIE
jgi:copper oxidase (laccase) domain-containing protein